MIYLILTEDQTFAESNLCLRINMDGKIKSFYIIRYVDNRDDAENYCKFGGFIPGTRTPRFSFQVLKKLGEK